MSATLVLTLCSSSCVGDLISSRYFLFAVLKKLLFAIFTKLLFIAHEIPVGLSFVLFKKLVLYRFVLELMLAA